MDQVWYIFFLVEKDNKYVLVCRPRWSNCIISFLLKLLNEEKYQNMPVSCWPKEAI